MVKERKKSEKEKVIEKEGGWRLSTGDDRARLLEVVGEAAVQGHGDVVLAQDLDLLGLLLAVAAFAVLLC